MKVHALDAVEDDLHRAARYYEAERSGWGCLFVDSYLRILQTVERFPQFYSLVDDGVPNLEIRNAIFDRFDYRAIYIVRPAEAVILTVTHPRRRPRHWHDRLDLA